jgi:hypothetical protein
MAPEHALEPHVTLDVPDSQSTPPEQLEAPHVTVQDCVALQVTPPEQPCVPQLSVQLVPPHTTPPEHELSTQSMLQLAAFEQSTIPLHPLVPQWTTHATPAGHTTPEEHLPAQSMTQLPAASHVPLEHDCAVHGPPVGAVPVVPDEQLTPMRRRALHRNFLATSFPMHPCTPNG